MYFAYDYKNALLQFSYCNPNETSEFRGVYGTSHRLYYRREGFFYFSLNIKLKNHFKTPDLRFYIKNRLFNFLINRIFIFMSSIIIFFKFLLKMYSFLSLKNRKILKFFIFFLCFSIAFFYFFVGDFYRESSIKDKKLSVSISEWQEIIDKMPLSQQIQANQNSYFEGNIPNIKGIYDFQVMPLGNGLKNANAVARYLAVPFQKIIALKSDYSMQIREPEAFCIGDGAIKYSIFHVDTLDSILIFKKEFSDSNKIENHFILAPKAQILSYNNKNICNYMVLN